AAAWPPGALAQQPTMRVIGYLSSRTRDLDDPVRAHFLRGLSLTLADLGRVCESILHASPDMGWNFYMVSAWPGHERNLMRAYFASNCRDGITEGENGF